MSLGGSATTTVSHDAQIPLFSDAAVHAGIDLAAPVQRVLDSQWFVLGQAVAAFESESAACLGAAHCVSLANGTDALELALRAVVVQPGDRVALVANAGFYGSTAVLGIGATPLLSTWMNDG